MAVAKALKNRCSVTLIEPRDRFFHVIGAPRALVEPGFEAGLFIPYDRMVSDHIRGRLTSIEPTTRTVTVELEGGGGPRMTPYDCLVLATGSSNALPNRASSVHSSTSAEFLASMRTALSAARVVAIVGGGAVGCDLASELSVLPGKEVHLIHRSGSLLSAAVNGAVKPSISAYALRGLASLGVHVRLNCSAAPPAVLPAGVASLDGGRVLIGAFDLKLSDGSLLHPDACFFATGASPNNAAFMSGPLAIDPSNGRLRVRPTLQVESYDNIFAIGDISSTTDSKNGFCASKIHAPLVTASIMQLARAAAAGVPLSTVRLREHTASAYGSVFLALGRRDGIGQLHGWTVPSFIVKRVKCKDLMTAETNASLGFGPREYPSYPGSLPPSAAVVDPEPEDMAADGPPAHKA